jgi:serine/threonine protein kinase
MTEEGDERLGTMLADRYELRAVIASGAQGMLYRAKDTVEGGDVAIKLLRHDVKDPDAVERLFREATAMTKLRGTAAVKVLDHVRVDRVTEGIVMELLRGRELRDELHDLEAAGERMPLSEVFAIFGPIVDTLEAARELGIVHRDVKPENIFIIHPAYGGGVRLLDFGFARFQNELRITQEGIIAGSPSHISPEAWAGVTDLDHRADVYAMGVVLFRVLGGRPPFDTGDIVKLMKAATGAPRPSLHALRPDLPREIDDWVEHALAIERERRFARVSALWKALCGCLPQGA